MRLIENKRPCSAVSSSCARPPATIAPCYNSEYLHKLKLNTFYTGSYAMINFERSQSRSVVKLSSEGWVVLVRSDSLDTSLNYSEEAL